MFEPDSRRYRREFLRIIAYYYGGRKRIRSRVTRWRRDHNAAQSSAAAQTAMIVLTIRETTMLAVHLLLFPMIVLPDSRLRHNLCRATVAN